MIAALADTASHLHRDCIVRGESGAPTRTLARRQRRGEQIVRRVNAALSDAEAEAELASMRRPAGAA